MGNIFLIQKMKFATLLALVATTQAAYELETPDDGAEKWDAENEDDEEGADATCECITVAEVATVWAVADAVANTSTDCTADGSGGATYTCNTDSDSAAVLTTAGFDSDYGDKWQNWDADQDWCD